MMIKLIKYALFLMSSIGFAYGGVSDYTFECIDKNDKNVVAKGEIKIEQKFGQNVLIVTFTKNKVQKKLQFFIQDVNPHTGLQIKNSELSNALKGNTDPMLTFLVSHGMFAAYPSSFNLRSEAVDTDDIVIQSFRSEPEWPVKFSNKGDSESPFRFEGLVDSDGVSESSLALKIDDTHEYEVKFKRKAEGKK